MTKVVPRYFVLYEALQGRLGQFAVPERNTLVSSARTDAPSGVPMSGGAEPAGAAKPHE